MRLDLAYPMTLGEILGAVGGVGEIPEDRPIRAISTDTRRLRPGDLFVALHGETTDGHRFLETALDQGAAACLCEETGDRRITVSDTHKAFLSLAKHSLSCHRIPVVAITGSMGKTSTKEAAAAALSPRLRVHKTAGNENNELGVAKTVLSRPEDAEILVLELGSNHPGEIAPLSEAIAPDVAILTAIGSAHIGAFGTAEAILREKASITAGMQGGQVILMKDDPYLATLALPLPTLGVSIEGEAELTARGIFFSRFGTSYTAKWAGGEERIFLRGVGRPRVSASLLALGCAIHMGIPVKQAADALLRMPPTEGRGSVHEAGGVLLIDDAYNASPEAVREGLLLLKDLASARRRIAVLGDMLELGDKSRALHTEVGRLAAQHAHALYAFGTYAEAMAEGALHYGMAREEIRIFPDAALCEGALLGSLSDGDAVLVKASHALGGKRIAEAIRERGRYAH